ncbi:sialidase family protein [Alteromonas gilva]|uniref:Photosynthesis system II assembly factor Ycf48/Hcf136-like domain-containing protein n=1 Tax=Alteromonas gilva TaxID=2987522 RepID=A0ABT5KZ26_9ALTE|nr:hypothetical protein [Alteromonas gilva]MDC8830022.1 hypothetical protein [Alteromonas gilva]
MSNTKLQLTAFIFTSFVLLSACQENPPPYEPTPAELNVTINSIELTGLTINEITRLSTANNSILSVAATSGGLYLLNGSNWQPVTSQRWEIQDFLAVQDDHWLAVVGADNSNQSMLIRSLDKGSHWSTVTNNFGGSAKPSEMTPEPIYRLASNAAGDKLYAVGTQVLAESLDAGTTWQAISGIWNGFARGYRSLINIPPEQAVDNTEIFFYGGQGAIENPLLRRFDVISSYPDSYTEGSETIMDVTGEDLLPVPSTIRSIVPVTAKEGDFVATGEGGLIRTFDNGMTWQALRTNDTSRFYFDLIIHPDQPDFWVTAGWNKNFENPQPFIVEVSLDRGESWQEFEWKNYDGDAIFGGVRSMEWADPDANQVHFGTTRGGIITVNITVP